MRAIFLFDFAVRGPQHREPDESCTERHALVLRTRPPVGQQHEKVRDAIVVVAVEVGGAAFARPPTCQERKQIGCADIAPPGFYMLFVVDGDGVPSEASLAQVGPGLVGDLDGDGIVGASDLLILLVSWGPCADCDDCPADLNGDCCPEVWSRDH